MLYLLYIVINLRTRPVHLITYCVDIMGLLNPTHIDRINKLMTNNKSDLDETFTEASDGFCLGLKIFPID